MHALQISALFGGRWLTLCPICFTPKDKSTVSITSSLGRPTASLDMSVPKKPRFNSSSYRNLRTNYIFVCYYDNMHKMNAQYSGCNISLVRMFHLQDYRNEVAENLYCGIPHNYWSTLVVTTQNKLWVRRSAMTEYLLLETPFRSNLGFMSTRGNFLPLNTTAVKANTHQGSEHVEPSGVLSVP